MIFRLDLVPRGGGLGTSLLKGFKALHEAKIWDIGYLMAKKWTLPPPTPLSLSHLPNLTLCLWEGGPKSLEIIGAC